MTELNKIIIEISELPGKRVQLRASVQYDELVARMKAGETLQGPEAFAFWAMDACVKKMMESAKVIGVPKKQISVPEKKLILPH